MVVIVGCKKEDDTTDEETLDTTLHDNNFVLLPDGFSPSMSFTWDGNYTITSGQPWEGVSSSGYHSGVQIVARAGRKGSSGNANWFISRVSAAACTTKTYGDEFPAELNFAFTGTLTIDGNAYPVAIGQGHSGAENNWWIGGFNWIQHGDIQEIFTPDNKYKITSDSDLNENDYLFWVHEN